MVIEKNHRSGQWLKHMNVRVLTLNTFPHFDMIKEIAFICCVLLLAFSEIKEFTSVYSNPKHLIEEDVIEKAQPAYVAAGLAAIAKGVIDLGAGNLTPFAAPVEGNELKTTGAFSYVRHPIYGGLLVAATGLGVATESFQRLLVVFLLYLLLDAKSAYEEKELERIHPAYRAYKQVTPKFFPSFDELDEILD